MKRLEIRHLPSCPDLAEKIPAMLDAMGISFEPVSIVNWPADYPYSPQTTFRMAWSEEGLALHYRVSEQSVRAHYAEDAGQVWTDSCVECFVRNEDTSAYYNIECNCIGTLLVGFGDGRHHRQPIAKDTLARVKRWSSLGNDTFDERKGKITWEVALFVPANVFSHSPLRLMSGAVLRANFYKCGDELSVPHFVSWNAIEVLEPDFHRPEFFGELLLIE